MFYALPSKFVQYKNHFVASLICISFILGFASGAVIASNNAELYMLMIRLVLKTPFLPAAVFAHIALPFCVTPLIYLSRSRILVFLDCFVHAFMLGVIHCSVYLVFGAAQWFIGPLVLFTKTSLAISLIWFWLRNISFQSQSLFRDFVTIFCVSLISAFFDMLIISPYLLSVFS